MRIASIRRSVLLNEISAFLLIGVLAAVPAGAATGGAPVTVPHGGYILDGSDQPVTATVSMAFRLYDGATAGTLQWQGTCASVALKAGYFAVVLGGPACAGTSANGLDPALDTADLPSAGAWLEVEVGGVTLSPRLAVLAVPRAADASALEGHPASFFATASHTHAAAAISGLATIATTGAWSDLQGTPTSFPPAPHAHPISDLTGVQAALDAKVSAGTLEAGKWCTSNGSTVSCTSDAPTGGTGGQAMSGTATPVACGPSTAGAIWFDAAVPSVKVCNGAIYTTLGAVTAPPGAPAGYAVSVGNGSVTFSWNTVSGAASYEIGYQPGTILDGGATIVAAAASPATITGLTNNQVYTTAVRSVQGSWRSAWSSTLQATPVPVWTCATVPTHAGCTSSSQYPSCKAIKDDPTFTGTSGQFWIDPDGAGTGAAPFLAYCDHATGTGGWTFISSTNAVSVSNWNTSEAALGTVTTPGSTTNARLAGSVVQLLLGGSSPREILTHGTGTNSKTKFRLTNGESFAWYKAYNGNWQYSSTATSTWFNPPATRKTYGLSAQDGSNCFTGSTTVGPYFVPFFYDNNSYLNYGIPTATCSGYAETRVDVYVR